MQALELLGIVGYDPSNVARPVKEVIQEDVENEVAKGMLGGEFKDRWFPKGWELHMSIGGVTMIATQRCLLHT